jgi:hypothetical protein
VKVRITRTPREPELDGVPLDRLLPGVVRDMPMDLAAWLVAERYADVEMRHDAHNTDEDFLDLKVVRAPLIDPDAPRRRSGDH